MFGASREHIGRSETSKVPLRASGLVVLADASGMPKVPARRWNDATGSEKYIGDNPDRCEPAEIVAMW